MPSFFNRRPSFSDRLRAGMRRQPQFGISDGSLPIPVGTPTPLDEQIPVLAPNVARRPLSEELQGTLDADMAAPSKKQSLLQAALQAGSIGAGALFGGTEGASGAAGAVESMDAAQARAGEERRKSLREQIEQARNHEFQTGERIGSEEFKKDERVAGQGFESEQSRLAREATQAEAERQRGFTSGEADKQRAYGTNERLGRQGFESEQAGQDRTFRTGERLGGEEFAKRQSIDDRTFKQGESSADRTFRSGESRLERDLKASEGRLDRTSREGMNSADNLAAHPPTSDSGDMVSSVIETIGQMEDHPGLPGAVGAKGPSSLFGLKSDPISGTNASNFARLVDTLKARLTLPNLKSLKGLGPASDRDMQIIAAAATSLDRSMDEGAFRAELDRIQEHMQNLQAAAAGKTPSGDIDNEIMGLIRGQSRAGRGSR